MCEQGLPQSAQMHSRPLSMVLILSLHSLNLYKKDQGMDPILLDCIAQQVVFHETVYIPDNSRTKASELGIPSPLLF